MNSQPSETGACPCFFDADEVVDLVESEVLEQRANAIISVQGSPPFVINSSHKLGASCLPAIPHCC
jgi:hypothetical protein